MKVLKPILDFYINSSIHVSLAVFSMAWLTLLEFEVPFDEKVLFFIFFASITGYNFVKYFGIAKFHHRSLATWLQVIQVFSLLCFLLMIYFAVQLETKTLFCIVVFGLVTFLYAIPFFPKHLFMDSQKNLRSIGGLKVYVIALVWAGVTVVLPLINADFYLNADVWITLFQRFVFVVILMLPFEIRDLQYDRLKLATIPQQIGIKNTKLIGVFIGIVFFFLEFFKDKLEAEQILITLIITVVALLFLVFSKAKQGTYYCSFWVEGIPIVWLLMHQVF